MKQKEHLEDYKVGDIVWNKVSHVGRAWRVGRVTKKTKTNNYYSGTCLVVGPVNGNRHGSRTVYNPWQVFKAEGIKQIPTGTQYLIGISLDEYLAKRCDLHCQILECSTRYQSTGKLLGHVIIPSTLGDVDEWSQYKSWKTWTIGPSPEELLSFLHSNLAEVSNTYNVLREQEEKDFATKLEG